MALSAPTVASPMYACTSTVVVMGFVPGATIDIFVTPAGSATASRVAGGVSHSPVGRIFGVPSSSMLAGGRVNATQTLNGETSPPAREVELQAPLVIDAPRLPGPLVECARCVFVDGLLPGAEVEVRSGPTVLASGSAWAGGVPFGLSRPLDDTDVVQAVQSVCGVPGPSSPGAEVGPVPEVPGTLLLGPPLVDQPIYACQPYVTVRACLPGATAELLVDGTASAWECAATGDAYLFTGTRLVSGMSVTARQTLCSDALTSDPSDAITVTPADDIPRPAMRTPLHHGDTAVTVAMTVIGEVVSVLADGIEIGRAGAVGGDASLNVDPALVAGQQVTATVELCGQRKESLPVTVLSRPATVDPPTVIPPLVACATEVGVTGCIPGAIVDVRASDQATSVLLGSTRTFTGSVVVAVAPLLHAGWKVTATQEVGGVASGPSGAVVVDPAGSPAPVTIVRPVLACARCLQVQGAAPGARVDVFEDGLWRGAADAHTTTVQVGVSPGLTAESRVTAIQTLCGVASEPSQELVDPAPEELPPPEIAPAFAGDQSVAVTRLIRGAVVEVEETSVYGLTVGRTCAVADEQAVQLGLPLFAGAVLRARQRLCQAGPFSTDVVVRQPREWPLGPGPYRVGSRRVMIPNPETPQDPFVDAIVYYPAQADGEETPFASGPEGPPFHLVAFGHANRTGSFPPCPGTPGDPTQDYLQMSTILSQLARWGFVCLSPEFLPGVGDAGTRKERLQLALDWLLGENATVGSPFHDRLLGTGIVAMGHSAGGGAAVFLSADTANDVGALALVAPGADPGTISGLGIPTLVLHGTQDTGGEGVDGLPRDAYNAATPPKHLVVIGGANHFQYTDELCVDGGGDGTATISRSDQQRIAMAYLVAFLRRHVLGVPDLDDYLNGVRTVEELEASDIAVSAET